MINSKILKRVITVLLFANGIFFISNIYVIGNTEAAVAMHADLAPGASPFMAQAKVIVTFLTGILYVLCAIGLITKRKSLVREGIIASAIFTGFYILEIILWPAHPLVWLGFLIMGGLAVFYPAFLSRSYLLEWLYLKRNGVIWANSN